MAEGTADLFKEFKAHFRLLIDHSTRKYLYLAIIYAVAISLLTLAVPISVQMLINTVANIASVEAIVMLSLTLLALLLMSGALLSFQTYTLELFERRFYASITAQFTLRNIYADQQAFRQINGTDLVNRYFDIMQVQKVIPSLISGFFATLLQMLVGIILVSFYHPWLFLFNLIFISFLWGICRVWGGRAMGTAIALSESKYLTARHLEDVALSNDFFKSRTRGDYAIRRTDALTHNYLRKRRMHFRNVFSQEIAFLGLYAISSSALLGLGGVLVVRGELTLGQLVAAELILSAVFFGISRLNYYLTKFYDLTAALEEISRVYGIKLERIEGRKEVDIQPGDLIFSNVASTYGNNQLELDCHIHAGEKILIKSSESAIQRCIADLLKRYTVTERGRLDIDGQDILDYKAGSLRDRVIAIDKTTVIESTILEYMQIHAPHATRSQINHMLTLVDLMDLIDSLPDGVDTHILANGIPLKPSEALRLKLAGALLAKPHVLVLNEHFDALSYARRQHIFDYICKKENIIVLYFSNRHDLGMFDRYMFIDWKDHRFLSNIDELRTCEDIHDIADRGGL